MALIVRYEPTGRELDLEHATEEDMAIIRELHDRPNGIHRGDKLLTCLKDWRPEQAGLIPPVDREMTVKYLVSHDTWFAAHLAGGSHGPHKITEAESLAHLRQKDYWCKAAESVGLQARTEVRADDCTLDVAITGGAVATDIECQRSVKKETKIAHRTRVYDKAGYLAVWFNAASGQRPTWLRTVPFLGSSFTTWNTEMPRPGTVRATGLGYLERLRCDFATFGGWPFHPRSRKDCGQRHPRVQAGVTALVEEVTKDIAARSIVPLRYHNGNVFMVRAQALADYREMTGGLGEWDPWDGGAPASSASARLARECRYRVHDNPEGGVIVPLKDRCNVPNCTRAGRLYARGRRCDEHKPRRGIW